MSSKSKIASLFLAAFFGFGLHVSLARAHIPIPPKQPSEIGRRVVKTAVPNFKLIDQNGKPFQIAGTRGNVVLATFIFTACPDVCPLLSAKFAAIQRALGENKTKDYWLLSITTDPERDSAASLKEYAARFKADLNHWSFLTGPRAELAKVWKAFGVNVTKTESGQIFHTALTTLIDRQGLRRVDYYGDKWLDKEVLKDIQWLGAQK
jgi:protein SCO1/2